MHTFKTNLEWTRINDFSYETFNRDHLIRFSNNLLIKSSAAVDFFGNNQLINPEELLTASLSSCHMLTFLAIASKAKVVVENYKDEATSFLGKNTEGKLTIIKIILKPKITFLGEPPGYEKIKKMHKQAHQNCFIAQTLKAEVEIL